MCVGIFELAPRGSVAVRVVATCKDGVRLDSTFSQDKVAFGTIRISIKRDDEGDTAMLEEQICVVGQLTEGILFTVDPVVHLYPKAHYYQGRASLQLVNDAIPFDLMYHTLEDIPLTHTVSMQMERQADGGHGVIIAYMPEEGQAVHQFQLALLDRHARQRVPVLVQCNVVHAHTTPKAVTVTSDRSVMNRLIVRGCRQLTPRIYSVDAGQQDIGSVFSYEFVLENMDVTTLKYSIRCLLTQDAQWITVTPQAGFLEPRTASNGQSMQRIAVNFKAVSLSSLTTYIIVHDKEHSSDLVVIRCTMEVPCVFTLQMCVGGESTQHSLHPASGHDTGRSSLQRVSL
jgi:hypothetical protein